jgi:hypothetical protein
LEKTPEGGYRKQTNNNTNMSTGWIKQGASAMEALSKAEQEQQTRKDRGYMPLRFWVPRNEEIEIVLLDTAFVSDEPGVGGALIREHNLKGPDGKWSLYESCCADFAPCALCDKAGTDGYGPAYHVVMMTALVLKPWTNKKTGEEHAYSRMLLPIKLGQKERFLDLQKAASRECGTMRGMYLVMRRGSGDQAVAIGEPVMLENGKLFDMIPESELIKEYGHPPIKNREGKIIKPANGDLEPFNYAELFPRPDPDDLAHRYGGKPIAGSRKASFDDSDEPSSSITPPRRRRAFQQDDEVTDSIPFENPDAVDEVVNDESPSEPARKRGRSPNAPW